ncbi:MAG: hypothetical protein ACOZBZ_02505 [Patescibacteria group bacterium]
MEPISESTARAIVDRAEQQLNDLLQLNKEISKDYIESYRVDIKQLRSLVAQVSILSSAVLAFGGALLGNKEIARNETLLLVAIALLVLVIISSMFYMLIVIENSIIFGWSEHAKLKDQIKRQIENVEFLIRNPEKYEEFNKKNEELRQELKQEIKERKFKRDKFLYMLLIFFTFGVVLIFLSLFEINISR